MTDKQMVQQYLKIALGFITLIATCITAAREIPDKYITKQIPAVIACLIGFGFGIWLIFHGIKKLKQNKKQDS